MRDILDFEQIAKILDPAYLRLIKKAFAQELKEDPELAEAIDETIKLAEGRTLNDSVKPK